MPAFLVDGRDGGGAEREQVGKQYNLSLVVGIPNHHAPQQAGTVRLRPGTGEPDDLVGKDAAVSRDREFFEHLVGGIVLQPCYEIDVGHGPAAKQRVVGVAAIHGHDGTRVQRKGIGQFHIATLGLGE